MPTEPRRPRPYATWIAALDQLEEEIRFAFPPPDHHNPRVHGKIPADVGARISKEIRSIRSTLRNLRKIDDR